VGANGGNAWGGGVNASVGSTLIIDRSTLKGNQAVGGNGGGGAIEFPADRHHFGGDALGGAIFQLVHSNLTVTNSSLLNNRVTGGKGGGGDYGGLGGDGSGGAVFTGSDMLKDTFNDTLVSSVATANHAVGGAAGTGTIQHGGGGAAEGGAFFFGSFSNAIVRRCTVTSNQAIGAGTASGGGLNSYGYSAAIIDSFFGDNQALGGVASFGAGGAIFAREFQRLAITGSTFRRNTAQGGAGIEGVDGGFGQGGAIRILGGGQKYSTVEIQSSVFSRDRALGGVGGSGANGGGALGGAIQNTDAILRITKCTCDSNSALAGAQGAGGTGGEAQGGAIQSDQANGVFLIACTVTRNRALGTIGKGGGIYLEPDTGMAQIKVSTVKKNVASTEGNDIYGPYTT
jgi:hypothetical protein